MKLLSFIANGHPSFGAVRDNCVVDLGARMAGCTNLRQLLETNRVAEAAKLAVSAAPDHPLDKITFAPVIPDPGQLDHIAGYSCYNEGSVRDWQRHTSQFLSGKTFAESGSFGPWLVTTDEIPDPSKLTLQTRLNGAVVQDTTTDLLITAIPELIAYISAICPLVPGDVIVTGTPGGVGAKRTPPLWMRPGDTVEVEISGIGSLRNKVIAEPA
jgi:hypothetical protein